MPCKDGHLLGLCADTEGILSSVEINCFQTGVSFKRLLATRCVNIIIHNYIVCVYIMCIYNGNFP